MITVIGTTYGSKAGVATFKPSTALRTEMAEVIMLSPYSKAAPNIPREINIRTLSPTPRGQEGHKSQNAAFSRGCPCAITVHDVFDGDNDDECPEYIQRAHTEHVVRRGLNGVLPAKTLSQCE